MRISANPPEVMDPEIITIQERLRSLDEDKVEELAQSISKVGLINPITVRVMNGGEFVVLVAGRHRLAAAIKLGLSYVNVVEITGSDTEVRLWEIAEYLHRADLTVQEEADHVAEWVRLTEAESKVVSGQNVQKPEGGRPEGGISKAARDLPVRGSTPEAKRKNVERDLKIASITPAARKAADEAGLVSQSDRLKIGSYADDEQVAAVAEIIKAKAERKVKTKSAPTAQVAAIEHTSDAETPEETAERIFLIMANNALGSGKTALSELMDINSEAVIKKLNRKTSEVIKSWMAVSSRLNADPGRPSTPDVLFPAIAGALDCMPDDEVREFIMMIKDYLTARAQRGCRRLCRR
jgi:hypothetical protein